MQNFHALPRHSLGFHSFCQHDSIHESFTVWCLTQKLQRGEWGEKWPYYENRVLSDILASLNIHLSVSCFGKEEDKKVNELVFCGERRVKKVICRMDFRRKLENSFWGFIKFCSEELFKNVKSHAVKKRLSNYRGWYRGHSYKFF